MIVELHSLRVQKIIIQSFIEAFQNRNQINFLYDKLKFIDTLTSSVSTEVSIVLEYIQIMKKLIKENYVLSIFTNHHNPLRFFILFVKLIHTFNTNTESMELDLFKIQKDAENLIIKIIDEIDNIDILRNWLFDDFEDELKVIDFLAEYNLLNLLNHSKVSKICDQIWTGNYDKRKVTAIGQAIKISEIGMTFRNLNIDLDKMTTVVSKKRCCSFLYYSWKLLINSINTDWKASQYSVEKLFNQQNFTKTPLYGFSLYKDSVFLQAFLESWGVIIMWICISVILILETQSRQNLTNTYSNITALKSQAQTSSVLSQIDTEYYNLNNYGENWFVRFRALVIINSMLICLFIQDCLHYLSIIIRRISIKALSYNLAAAIIIDFIHTVGAIYLIIQYWTYYNINRTLTRAEEKYYKMFLSTETGEVQPKNIFVYLIIVIVYRMLYQLVYFKAFGPIVQIIIKMITKCFVFLILSLMFLFAFTLMGFILFYDINEFSSIFYSFNTMYQSIFGGFDFTIYTKSNVTKEYYGRIFMCLFLLGFAVLVMNFLIAILSEVYSYNAKIANALHKKEIVKLRALYEPHKHYYCLVKAPIFINFYMILVAPFVIIWKSEKLNKVVILFQYLIVFVFIQIGIFINLIVILPIFVVFIVYRKISYIFSKSTWASDILIRIIDIIVILLTMLIYTVILYTASIISEVKLLFGSNFIKIVGIYAKQYQYINTIMDGSASDPAIDKFDSIESQKIYFKFKKVVNPLQSKFIKYNPTNWMISEVSVCLMVACMKIIKRNIQLKLNNGRIDDSIPLFIPTEYVITELQNIMCLSEQLKAIIFGDTYTKLIDIESPRFQYLLSTLADKTLGGIELDPNEQQNISDVVDTGTNLITLVASLSNHEQRIQYWSSKLFKLFTESNNQWLIDQFHICKVFLYLNSFKAGVTEVNEEIWNANEGLCQLFNKFNQAANDAQDLSKNLSKLPSKLQTKLSSSLLKSKESPTVHLIDIPTLIGSFVGFEKKIREKVKCITDNGKSKIAKKMMKELWSKNQITMTRFLSSWMSTWYTVWNTYATKG